jgi:hypothetical protein
MISLEFRRAPIAAVEVVRPPEPLVELMAGTPPWPDGPPIGPNPEPEPSYMYAGALADEAPPADLVTIDLRDARGEFSIGGELWPCLSKLIEEAAEVGQVAAKIIGAEGATIHFDGSDLRERLVEEMGDVLAAIDVVIELNRLPIGHVTDRRYYKREVFRNWHADRLAERRATVIA